MVPIMIFLCLKKVPMRSKFEGFDVTSCVTGVLRHFPKWSLSFVVLLLLNFYTQPQVSLWKVSSLSVCEASLDRMDKKM
jgi:hypothetical protein